MSLRQRQKYKRCCLPRDEAAANAPTRGQREAEASALDPAIEDDDGLDDASSVVLDLIDAGRLDESEQAAQALDRCQRRPYRYSSAAYPLGSGIGGSGSVE